MKSPLTQVGLIDRIIKALQINDLGPVDTPADDVLGKDPDGDPPNCAFNYPYVIGMLWYVEAHTRPDLGFALSQAARFAFSPKQSHELALICVGEYLKVTREHRLTMKPTDVSQLNMDV